MTDTEIDELEEAIDATRRVYTLETATANRVEEIRNVARMLALKSGSSTIAEQIINLRMRARTYAAAYAPHRDHLCEIRLRMAGDRHRELPLNRAEQFPYLLISLALEAHHLEFLDGGIVGRRRVHGDAGDQQRRAEIA